MSANVIHRRGNDDGLDEDTAALEQGSDLGLEMLLLVRWWITTQYTKQVGQCYGRRGHAQNDDIESDKPLGGRRRGGGEVRMSSREGIPPRGESLRE